ncbi:MAG TPA: hypothetical protein VGM56_29800, partial [Byssovorax sp.]
GGERAPAPAACPDIEPGRYVLGKQFVSSGPIDAKIRTYAQASNDVAGVANQAELEVAQACTRVGLDLGVPASAMQPRQENGGRASGACGPAAAAVDGIMRQGAAVIVRVTPPFCSPNGVAQSQCGNACNVNPGDAECAASCRAHGEIYATCTPALIMVAPQTPNALSLRLSATLSANLPALLHAELALGRRLGGAVGTVSQVGSALPGLVGQAGGAMALGCVTAGQAQVNAASWQLQATVRASALVTNRVGATSG